jgi:flagellar biosynthesis/type III secretory pathway protein FliH
VDNSKIAELLVLLAALQVQVTEAQAKLGDVEALIAEEKKASYDLGKVDGFAEGKTAGYALGFEDGKASVPVGPGGFTQEQVDALIVEATDPLKKALAEKELELAAVKESIPAQIDEQVKIALVALKADLLAKLKAQQAVETESELSFEELLK